MIVPLREYLFLLLLSSIFLKGNINASFREALGKSAYFAACFRAQLKEDGLVRTRSKTHGDDREGLCRG